MKGYVYILTNPSMPGIVKIGRTTRSVHGRAGELFQTGVPTPFEVAHYVQSPDCVALERAAHERLALLRVGTDREFFRCDHEAAHAALKELHYEQVLEWLDQFLPDHTLVQSGLAVDEADIALVCNRAGVAPELFVMCFDLLDPSAVAACVSRREKLRALAAQPSELSGGLVN